MTATAGFVEIFFALEFDHARHKQSLDLARLQSTFAFELAASHWMQLAFKLFAITPPCHLMMLA